MCLQRDQQKRNLYETMVGDAIVHRAQYNDQEEPKQFTLRITTEREKNNEIACRSTKEAKDTLLMLRQRTESILGAITDRSLSISDFRVVRGATRNTIR